MYYVLAVAFLLIDISTAFQITNVTGTTPEPCTPKMANNFCAGKADGNYEFVDKNGNVLVNLFIQCSNGLAYCQNCWPESLEFSQQCNQCLYKKTDACYTTQVWLPRSTYSCPDLCVSKGPTFTGNLADINHPDQYIACWEGITMGCIICPAGLLFNEAWNMCLYDGKYVTLPSPP